MKRIGIWLLGWLPATKNDIRKLIMKTADLAATLQKIDDQLDKAKTEIVGQIQALKDALANAGTDVPPEAQAALDRLTTLAQALDDITPDAPPPTT